jgi:hypothetical protein
MLRVATTYVLNLIVTKPRFLSIIVLVTYAYARAEENDFLLYLSPKTGSQMSLISTSRQTELDS